MRRRAAVETFRRNVSTAAVIGAIVLFAWACDGRDDPCYGPPGACGPTGAPPATSPATSTLPSTTPSADTTLIRFPAANLEVTVEVADTPEERSVGLMDRRALAPDSGMLFAYEEDTQATFYMRNTYVPLSIAFISATGEVLEIEDMEPLTEDTHSAPGPYRYALEMNQGWFAEHGIAAGDSAEVWIVSQGTTDYAPVGTFPTR